MNSDAATALDPLILDLLEWLADGPRPLGEVREAWRTSCPRLTVWEDAHERGLIERGYATDSGAVVAITRAGRAFLAQRRPSAARAAS